MAEFQTLTAVIHKSTMNVGQILQDFSYNVCSTMSPNFTAFGLFILVFGKPPLYTSSLLLCYEDIRDSSVEKNTTDILRLKAMLNFAFIYKGLTVI